jgi:subtilase family serine protease
MSIEPVCQSSNGKHTMFLRRPTAASGQRRHLAFPAIFEALEPRQFLSASASKTPLPPSAHQLHLLAVHDKALRAAEKAQAASKRAVVFHVAPAVGLKTVDKPQATYSPVLGTYIPAQVRTAYGISSLPVSNEGQGMTIGIVDELDDANITSDANVFSSQYGLPLLDGVGGDPTLTVTKDQALGTVTTAAGTGVGSETSLDVEWAHAMAPKANILLVEVPATGSAANEFAQLLHGVQLAATDGADVVSLSYGYPEALIGNASVVSLNSTYLSSGAATTVPVTVSTGDYSTPLFPATSPNVIAVGGSSLYFSSVKGKYALETAWGGLSGAGAGGGGLSTNFAAPTFQTANGVGFAKRAIPDVSLIADPVTAVSVYDSLDTTVSAPSPWVGIGGTSLATPVFAGMLSLAQQTRLAASKSLLTSASVDNAIYSTYNSGSYSTYFHDITLGNNSDPNNSPASAGFSATTGYDLATGVGSPIGNSFMQYLATVVA